MRLLFILLLLFSYFTISPSYTAFAATADSDLEDDVADDDFNDDDFNDGVDPEDLEREELDEDDLERELINEDEDDLEKELINEDEDDLERELINEDEDDLEKELTNEDEDDLELDADTDIENDSNIAEESEDDSNTEEESEDDLNATEEESPDDSNTTEEESEDDLNATEESQDDSNTTEESPDDADSQSFAEEAEEFSMDEDEGVSFTDSLNIITNLSYIADKNEIHITGSNVISHQSKINEENKQLVIEILQAKITQDLKWPYILRDFNTGFGLVKADQKDESTVRIVIQLKEGSPFPNVKVDETSQNLIIYFGNNSSSYKSSGKFTNQTLPSRTLEELYFGNITFTGSPISFHVIDAPIGQVLRFISEESGLNLVISEGVTGKVTLKLESVPWDQALYTILKVKDLGYTREGSVITISPLSQIEARVTKLREIVAQQRPLTPFKTKAISVSYGKLTDIKSKVEEFLTKGSSTAGQGQASGKAIIHEESNTLIIVDTADVIKKIEGLVSYLDQTPQQVMVEARIVEAEETLARDFGLKWGLSGNLPVTVSASGIVNALQNMTGSYSGSHLESGQLTLNLSGIPIVGDIGASLNIAESNGYARVVSSPKIVTISGKTASITRNSPIQIRDTQSATQSADGGETVRETFKTVDVKISLEVTPIVTSSKTIFLKVNISRSNPGAGRTVQTTRTAQTEVLVKDGHTIVIGGIYQYDEGHGRQGIPFFKNIPILKYLFDRKESNSAKNELLVFLTPKIINSVND